MKVEGRDKNGRPWWVESDKDIVVTTCPNCGNPVAIINTNEAEIVEKVIFYNSGQGTEGLVELGEFTVKKLEYRPPIVDCPWCHYPRQY